MGGTDDFDLEELDDLIRLTDENGREVPFEFLDLIPYQGGEYAVLCEPDGNEISIFEIRTDSEKQEESYIGVEDGEVLQAVFDIFKEKYRDQYDFES